MTRSRDDKLRAALHGVRGLLLDMDGVLVLKGALIPGAGEAIGELERRGIPYRIVTNSSMVSRARLARWSAKAGVPIPAERYQSALSVSAAYTAAHYPGQPLFVMASDDAKGEFAGQRLLTTEEAGAPDSRAGAVVIGDSPEEVTYDNLNHAFRLIQAGAELIGMHRNRWWLTAGGPTIDSGAIVTGLEYSAGVRARILGKPAPEFFRIAAAEVATQAAERDGGRRATRRELAMVGDDLWTDVFGSQRVGLRGIFVMSGKHGRSELERAAAQRRGGGRPDGVAASLSDVVAALD